MKRGFSPRDPVTMFNSLTSNALQFDLGKQIYLQYKLSAGHCNHVFLENEVRDVLPYYRRASIESGIVDCLEKYADVKVSSKTNSLGNCSHRIIISDKVLMTQSYVRHRKELPRDSIFREGYARSGQGYLFDDDRPPDPDPSMHLYAIVTHSPSTIVDIPEFIDVIFPDENYETIVDRIKLLDKFPKIADITAEQIRDNLSLREKLPDIKLKTKGTA